MPRPKTITLAPTALDRNGISVSQTKAAGDLEFTISGALSAGYDADGIAQSQTPAGAGNLTLNGALQLGKFYSSPVRVSITGGSDESGKTFTVTGKNSAGATITEAITGPNATTVFGSTEFAYVTQIAVSAATTGAITAGVQGTVTLGTPQHITVFSAADDTGVVFTVTGTDRYGNAITENITGENAGTAAGLLNFATVTKVVADGATTGAAEVGVDGTAESEWYILDYRVTDTGPVFGCTISSGATLTYNAQHTFQELFAADFDETTTVATFNHATVAGENADAEGVFTNTPVAMRLAITAHTSGSVVLRIVQGGSS